MYFAQIKSDQEFIAKTEIRIRKVESIIQELNTEGKVDEHKEKSYGRRRKKPFKKNW